MADKFTEVRLRAPHTVPVEADICADEVIFCPVLVANSADKVFSLLLDLKVILISGIWQQRVIIALLITVIHEQQARA